MAAWMIPAAIAAAGLIGGSSSRSAAKTQAAAADRAAELQNQQFERQIELQAPFREVGLRALNKLEGASDYTPFGMDQFQQDPGYAFRMSEGMKALERGAAARGSLMSGATMKGLQRYGQDLASQEYTNAFNRYGIERERRLNPLQSLAGVGQTSTNQLGAAGQNYANAAGQAIGAAGQARASGYMGSANSLSGALGQYMNYNQQQQQNQLLTQLMNRNAGIYGSIGTGGGYGGGVTNFSDFDGS